MSKKQLNPWEVKKDSLVDLALKITARNIEKREDKEKAKSKKKTKSKSSKKTKKKPTTNFRIIKMSDGSLVHFIPGTMHEKGFKRKLMQNYESIVEFIEGDEKSINL